MNHFFQRYIGRHQFVLTVLLFMLVPLGIALFFSYRIAHDSLLNAGIAKANSDSTRTNYELHKQLAHVSNDLLILTYLTPLQNALDTTVDAPENHEIYEELTRIFLITLNSKQHYQQLRYIDATGREKVRVAYQAGQLLTFDTRTLLNQITEDFFVQASQLPAGNIAYSPVHLRRDSGRISIPITPIMQLSTPLYNSKQQFSGVLVLDVLANTLFSNEMDKDSQTYIVNQAGFYLTHPSQINTYGFEYGKTPTANIDFPLLSQYIENKKLQTFTQWDEKRHDVVTFNKFFVDTEHKYYWLMITTLAGETIFAPLYTMQAIISAIIISIFFILAIRTVLITQIYSRFEKQLFAQERLLRLVINSIPHHIAWKDVHGRFLGCNQNFVDFVGLQHPEQLLQRTDYDLPISKTVNPDIVRLSDERVMQSNLPSYHLTDIIHLPNGQEIWVENNKIPLHDARGRVIGILTMTEDITQRKQAEMTLQNAKEVAERANKAKSQFLASMSHELRTPLNGILGYAQLLRQNRELSPKQIEGLSVIQRSGEHLLTLINDILDLAKVEAGRFELQLGEIRLNQFLSDLNDLFSMRAAQKGIAFFYTMTTHLPEMVRGDEKRLRQILINLLGNAIKFTEQGERVNLSVGYVERDETSTEPADALQKIRFLITDTGIGIPQPYLEKIFIPFQQVDNEVHRRMNANEGTGLGLTISRTLVEMMGGCLHVNSIVGQGSQFWFDIALPALTHDSLQSSPPVSYQQIIGYQEQTYSILIIEDSLESSQILLNLLAPLGFMISEASNGIDGFEKAMEIHPDVILIDLLMPEMDGFALTRRLRAFPLFKDTIIIAISASTFDYTQTASLSAGCNAFISKPIYIETLLDILQKKLNLTWVYNEQTSSNTDVRPSEIMLTIPLDIVENLYQLALTGKTKRVLNEIEKLAKENPELTPLLEKIRPLAKGFQNKKICDLLEFYRTLQSSHQANV
ncbi:ATP-binding protein [Beggiatoa leptomitoformis]|uniref:histidine kinase n=1 Tax=Beggiatoa leptomitoformis TaxID=288004 RepID=A0A2N9YB17_9GAMM|nr:ATP-binding protein [Beggiatoa leptomitoformis]AUI67666.1 response regulator [Beggiatoa leptomitoformis]QGX03523.1 response regulator [Beggiatoa leptomitoformis]